MNMKDILINVGAVLLFSPLIVIVLLFALPFMLGDMLYSAYRKEPKPKIPQTVDVDGVPAEEIGNRCLEFIKRQLDAANYEVKKTESELSFVSNMPNSKQVTFDIDKIFSIEINELNTYEWFIDEHNHYIDLYLWVVIGVLRGGVMRARSRIGRVTYWVWCKELNVWVVVQKAGSSYDSIHYYAEPPEHIKAQFVESK